MKNIIAGTAGHIDHGKTALVRALTGIDTDRLKEEKRRGITIDIGFAHLQLTPELRIGFVDVPGHERFVKNMLAGVGGIDLVLFVIAADESIKPQTREHFDICKLLGIERGIVVLTKADLVDPDILGLVRLEVEEFVAGSFLEGAPAVAVSSVTGQGIDLLRAELESAAAAVRPKDAGRWFRLPIDRAFSMRGFGTVVTGTLISGTVHREQEVEIQPGGRRVRVRGLQVHSQPAEAATAGQRTALNLADIEPAELARGMVLTEPATFHATQEADCEVELLASAKPLKNRAPVHFHHGTAEIEAEVRWLDRRAALKPGHRAYARITLREPALLAPQDRFIIRMFSPVVTIGGGVVIDNTGRRYRRGDDPAQRLAALASPDPWVRVARLVRESACGMGTSELVGRTGLMPAEIVAARFEPRLVALSQPEPWLMDHDWFQAQSRRFIETVTDFHARNPLLPGMPKQDLRGKELRTAPGFVVDAILAACSPVAVNGDLVRLKSHRLVLKDDEELARNSIERAFEQAGLAVPALQEVLAKSGVDLKRARPILQLLVRDRRLIRISDDLIFHCTAIAKLKEMLAGHRSQRFSVPVFKDWTGVSRKYAIPLLEYLDREKATRREGDERVVL